ncbi:MAG: hypothetical protein IT427_16275 [Pirellulales bacterium]|nr:hypothetical protein [Pirellulales bacterium]
MNATIASPIGNEAPAETAAKATLPAEKYPAKHFRRGKWVQIRSEAEIRATLDADGNLEGLPFMPEQIKYCGRKFRIYRRADRVYLDHHHFVVRLKNTVLLDDLRCDGSAHGGCQMKCTMFWKHDWLRPASAPTEGEQRAVPPTLISLTNHKKNGVPSTSLPLRAPTEGWSGEARSGEIFTCQATELARIGSRLSGWDPRQYLGDVLHGERSIGEAMTLMGKQARNTLRRWFPGKKSQNPSRKPSKPAGAPLNLQPGELVEVKSWEEIEETLNSDSRLRGLGFSPDMIPFCGKKFRVTSRVERMILEWTGELKQLRDTVALDTVHCDGSSCRGCPRNCFFLWREDWLKRAEEDR